jgi:hypothetical protein
MNYALSLNLSPEQKESEMSLIGLILNLYILLAFSMFCYKLANANQESLESVFDIVNKEGEFKTILDNLQESIITFEDGKIDFKNKGIDELFGSEVAILDD